eukprot:scaffold4_cov247-Pinguiococcus_pyrenoidosus.AAC.4
MLVPKLHAVDEAGQAPSPAVSRPRFGFGNSEGARHAQVAMHVVVALKPSKKTPIRRPLFVEVKAHALQLASHLRHVLEVRLLLRQPPARLRPGRFLWHHKIRVHEQGAVEALVATQSLEEHGDVASRNIYGREVQRLPGVRKGPTASLTSARQRRGGRAGATAPRPCHARASLLQLRMGREHRGRSVCSMAQLLAHSDQNLPAAHSWRCFWDVSAVPSVPPSASRELGIDARL